MAPSCPTALRCSALSLSWNLKKSGWTGCWSFDSLPTLTPVSQRNHPGTLGDAVNTLAQQPGEPSRLRFPCGRGAAPSHGVAEGSRSELEMEVWTMVSSDNLSAQVERKVSRRRLVRDSALTAGALALASQIDTKYALAQDEGPIKIGWLGDRTGDFSVVGVQKFNAANLAVKELNDAGGILGREVDARRRGRAVGQPALPGDGAQAHPAGQGRCPPCLLHLRLTGGHPADRRPEQDALLLQQPVRRWRLRLLGIPHRLRARSPGRPIRASGDEVVRAPLLHHCGRLQLRSVDRRLVQENHRAAGWRGDR